MKPDISRRGFLGWTTGASLALVGHKVLPTNVIAMVEPIRRKGSSRLALSMAAYSFRQYFDHADASKRITLFDFIDYCADHGVPARN